MVKSVNPRADRRPIVLPCRVTWKDTRGTTRFASVQTRDVSETGVFIEWKESTSIPMYRLVSFQLERDARNVDGLPPALGAYLSALQSWQSGLIGELERLSAQADAPLAVRYEVTNLTPTRALDAAAAAAGTVRSVLGTLIADLQDRGALTDRAGA